MKRLGLIGTGLLVLTALLAASGAVPAGASHPQSLCIDAEPDRHFAVSNDDLGDSLTVSRGGSDADHPPDSDCHIEAGSTGDSVEIDFEVTGAADPDSGDSPETPDLTCTIEAEASTCSIVPPVSGGGSQEIVAWVDEDQDNQTIELDLAEGQDEDSSSGDAGEPDNTDVVEWMWTHRDPPQTVVTIRYQREEGSFKGSIGAPIWKCQRGRTVTVKRRKPGRDLILKSDISNRRGNWRVSGFPLIRGKFYAVARPKKFIDHAGNEQRCNRAFSPTVRIR